MKRVWFIRHGESVANAGETTSDMGSAGLSPLGWRQAEDIAASMQEAPGLVVVTPYLRAQQTAIPTMTRFPGIKQEIWPLQEFAHIAAAHYENKTGVERKPVVERYWDRCDPDYVDGPGAESFNVMIGRIHDGLDRLKNASEDFIAVFAHMRILGALRFVVERPDLSGQALMPAMRLNRKVTKVANGEIIHATIDNGIIRLDEEDAKKFERSLPSVLAKREPHRIRLPVDS